MAHLARKQRSFLIKAIASEEFLQRVLGEIARLHEVVFHADKKADWDLVVSSAEQILVSEIVLRHDGQPLGVFYALRAIEDGGQSWDAAIGKLAAAIHSYFTTPLGIVMRQNLFGKDAVFISPDAHTWTAQTKGQRDSNEPPTS